MPDTETFMQREAKLRLEPRQVYHTGWEYPLCQSMGCCRHTGGEGHLCRKELCMWPESEIQSFPAGFKDT